MRKKGQIGAYEQPQNLSKSKDFWLNMAVVQNWKKKKRTGNAPYRYKMWLKKTCDLKTQQYNWRPLTLFGHLNFL